LFNSIAPLQILSFLYAKILIYTQLLLHINSSPVARFRIFSSMFVILPLQTRRTPFFLKSAPDPYFQPCHSNLLITCPSISVIIFTLLFFCFTI
jgi:hypothetical protein